MVTFDSLGLILSISSSILPGFQHTMAFSQDWGETVKKKNHLYLQFVLHIQSNYNYNQTFHLTASPTTVKITIKLKISPLSLDHSHITNNMSPPVARSLLPSQLCQVTGLREPSLTPFRGSQPDMLKHTFMSSLN